MTSRRREKETSRHPAIREPKNPSIKIWRYMDFPKFTSMLFQKGLFFVRASVLSDLHEGSMPEANRRARDNQNKIARAFWKSRGRHRAWIRQWTKVNCWHINESESEAMWRIYSESGKAIAIQSTFERLRGELKKDILCGEIKYSDYRTATIPEPSYVEPFMNKRESFSHERELRALTMDKWPQRGSSGWDYTAKATGEGEVVPVNLNKLIEKVLISPMAPDWYLEATRDVVKKYRLKCEVSRSSLDTDPFY